MQADRADRGGRPVPLDPAPAALGDDPEMAALELALSTAGAGARTATPAGPTPAFSSTLRARLLGELLTGDDRTREVSDRSVVATDDRTPAALMDDRTPALADERTVLAEDRTRATVDDRTRPRPVTARTAWHLPALMPERRAFALAMAAVLVIGLLGVGTLRLLPTALDATVVVAAGAQLVRDGSTGPLLEGVALRAGDVVRVASDGAATLTIDRGETRLAGGAELRIVALSRGAVALEQLTGRAWHRVAVPNGTPYRVTTGMVEWTALGTAFDLDRTERADGRDTVHAIGVEHAVRVAGPDLAATLDAGREATIVLGAAGLGADLLIGDLDATILGDPWLRDNARRDTSLGFDAGVLTAVTVPSPSPVPPASPVAVPSASPSSPPPASPSPSPEPSVVPNASPAVSPSPKPTATTTPKPTPTATAKPTPTPSPSLGALSLALRSCPGGMVLDWSPSKSEAFDHYTVVRGTASFEPPTAYPPEPPIVALDGTYTTDASVTTARDAGLETGTTYWYRALAFDAEDRVIATSPLKSAAAKGVKALGELTATPGAGQVELGWTPYGGAEACFTYYKVVWSTTTKTPSYLGENDGAIPLGSQADDTLTVDGLEPGAYWFRVQAIRTTDLGKFIVAQTSVAKVLVP